MRIKSLGYCFNYRDVNESYGRMVSPLNLRTLYGEWWWVDSGMGALNINGYRNSEAVNGGEASDDK
jgi:hypothetical protein